MRGKMSAEEMQAARLIVDGQSTNAVAAQIGIDGRTLRHRATKPYFVAYMDKLRAEDKVRIEAEAEAAKKKIKFGLPDAIEVLAKIAQTNPMETKGEGAVQIQAIKVLATLLKWVPLEVPAEGESAPAKPDVYKAAWMQ
jgi:hypothetical protein